MSVHHSQQCKKAVLVYADGRTSAVEGHGFGLWYVQAVPPADYRDRSVRNRYFKNTSIAFTEKSEDGGPKLGCIVFVERSEEEFRA